MTADPRLHPAGDPPGADPSPGLPNSSAVPPDPSRGPPDSSAAPGSSSGYVDLGAMILDEEPNPVATRMTEADEHVEPDEDFTAALSRFRARLTRNLASGDARTHQDMGTAYLAMGLGHEAIGEFQQAVREDPASPAAYEMLGRCFLDAGQPDLAASALEKALELPRGSEDRFLGIYYYMGRAQEASGNPEAAYDFYRKTLAVDIDFKDVGTRFRDLGRALRKPTGESADGASGSSA